MKKRPLSNNARLALLGGTVLLLAACGALNDANLRYGVDLDAGGATDQALCERLWRVNRDTVEKSSDSAADGPQQEFMAASRQELITIRTELHARHPDWRHWDQKTLAKILVGMTKDEAICSWGKPDRVNRASYAEQWVYNAGYWGNPFYKYLYFKGDKLIAWDSQKWRHAPALLEACLTRGDCDGLTHEEHQP